MATPTAPESFLNEIILFTSDNSGYITQYK